MACIKTISEDEEKMIIELTLKGYTQREIYRETNICGERIRNVLNKYNIKRPSKNNSEIIRYHQEGYDELVKNIIHDYLNNNSIEEVGNIYNLHYQTISKILHNNNIDTKENMKKKYNFNEKYFDEIDNQNKAYFLGFLIADGNVSKTSGRICIDLQSQDKHILESFCSELGMPNKHLSFNDRSHTTNQDVYYLTFTSNHMKDALSKYGIVPNKSLIYEYPDNIPRELIRHLLRGYFDGDGCFTISNSSCHIFLIGTYQFMDYLRQYIEVYIGCHCCFYQHKNNKNTYVINISGKKNCYDFLSYIYQEAELFLFRKYNKFIDAYNINNSLLA